MTDTTIYHYKCSNCGAKVTREYSLVRDHCHCGICGKTIVHRNLIKKEIFKEVKPMQKDVADSMLAFRNTICPNCDLDHRQTCDHSTESLKMCMEKGHPGIRVYPFSVTVQHDKGRSHVKTMATDKAAAKQLIMKAEGCPESAIISVKQLKKDVKMD